MDAGAVPGTALEEGEVGPGVVPLYPVTVAGGEVATASLEYRNVSCCVTPTESHIRELKVEITNW